MAVIKSASTSDIASNIEVKLELIELKFSSAKVGVVVRLEARIPVGIASYASFCCQLRTIDPPSFSTKLIAPVTSADVLAPGKDAVPMKFAMADPLSTMLMAA